MTVKDIVIDLSNYSNDDYSIENLGNSTYVEDSYVPTIESLVIPCGSVVIQSSYGAPEAPIGCGPTKYSGGSINLQASPNGAIGPYYVRFWRMPNVAGAMSYGEVGTVTSVNEGNSRSTSITLYDLDIASAIGKPTAGTPTTDVSGNITDPLGNTAPLLPGKIRVATTVYDSCPTEAKVCLSYCDVALGCVAPTCNFTVL